MPRPRGLLETVERLVEPADHVWTRGVNKSRWMTAVDCLSKMLVQKSVLNIQLMHRPRASKSQREHRADCRRLHHRTEGLIVVNLGALSETQRTQRALSRSRVPSTHRLSLDSLAGDDVGAGRTRHQIPSLVGEERRVLLFYRAAPVRVQQGSADGRGYRRDLQVVGHRRKSSGPQGTSRVLPHHRMDMTQVAVKKRRVVHRRRSTCSRGPQRRSRCGRQRGGHRWWRCRRWRHHWWRPRQGRPRRRRGHPQWRRMRDRLRPALVDVHRLGEAHRGCNEHRLGAGCRRNGHRRPWARVRCSRRNHLEGRSHWTCARHRVEGCTGGRRAGTRCR